MTAERRRGLTVRVRVTVVATLAVLLVLVAAGVLLVLLQMSSALDQLDETLSDEAEAIGAAVANGGDIPTLSDDDRVVVVFDELRRVLASAGRYEELAALEIVTTDDKGVDRFFAGQSHRVVSELIAEGDRTVRVVLAEPRDELDDSVHDLVRSLAWIIPSATLVLLVVVWLLVGRTLRPVERIRAEVDSIGIDELDRRVPEPAGGDEIARLASTMNRMLARLESSVRRQQQFVADASHELRTPLARMRAELEADGHHGERADASAARRSQLEEVAALQRLIEDLLLLARSDAGAMTAPFEPVDLDDIVLEEARTIGDISIDSSRVSGAQVDGAAGDLRRMVRNLVDNARHHASTTVAVGLGEDAGHAVLTVDDDGPGIPADGRSAVFERFTRLDRARPGGAGRVGLGLAIVREIVVRHGGEIEIDESPLGGARFVVRLPLSAS